MSLTDPVQKLVTRVSRLIRNPQIYHDNPNSHTLEEDIRHFLNLKAMVDDLDLRFYHAEIRLALESLGRIIDVQLQRYPFTEAPEVEEDKSTADRPGKVGLEAVSRDGNETIVNTDCDYRDYETVREEGDEFATIACETVGEENDDVPPIVGGGEQGEFSNSSGEEKNEDHPSVLLEEEDGIDHAFEDSSHEYEDDNDDYPPNVDEELSPPSSTLRRVKVVDFM